MKYWRTATGQCFHRHPVCFGLKNSKSTHPTPDIYGLRPCSLCDGTDPCTGDNCAECAYQKKCIEEDTRPLKKTWRPIPIAQRCMSFTSESPLQTEPRLRRMVQGCRSITSESPLQTEPRLRRKVTRKRRQSFHSRSRTTSTYHARKKVKNIESGPLGDMATSLLAKQSRDMAMAWDRKQRP